MTNRTDAIGLKSFVWLSVALAFTMMLRRCNSASPEIRPTIAAVPIVAPLSTRIPVQRALEPQPPLTTPEHLPPVTAQQKPVVSTTPTPTRPHHLIYLPKRLRVEPSRWSAPLPVPENGRIGIRFTIARIRVERDGVDAGIIYRDSTGPNGTNVAQRLPSSLSSTPRVFWFEKGARLLRFISLDENQTEDVEVLWNRGG